MNSRQRTDQTLRRMVHAGVLGKDVHLKGWVIDSSKGKIAQFASVLDFVIAEFRSDRGAFHLSLIIKYNKDNQSYRELRMLDNQFRNEEQAYTKVLPFLNKYNLISELFPKCYFCSVEAEEDPTKYLIVLEDLSKSNFKMSKDIVDLDFTHSKIAFQKLGTFHALSFAAKHSNTFFGILKNLVDVRYFEGSQEEHNYQLASSVGRAAEPLLERGKYVQEIQRFKENLKDALSYYRNLISVQEPMGVICHGDFCRNNVLYRYEDGTPVDAKIFDLATLRYSSPMTDFSFFLFLSCSEESRKRLSELLKVYHDSVSSTIPGLEVPSLEEFEKEFRKKAVFGFLVASFFKPCLMEFELYDSDKDLHMTISERTAMEYTSGGESGTKDLASMLELLLDLKCVL